MSFCRIINLLIKETAPFQEKEKKKTKIMAGMISWPFVLTHGLLETTLMSLVGAMRNLLGILLPASWFFSSFMRDCNLIDSPLVEWPFYFVQLQGQPLANLDLQIPQYGEYSREIQPCIGQKISRRDKERTGNLGSFNFLRVFS